MSNNVHPRDGCKHYVNARLYGTILAGVLSYLAVVGTVYIILDSKVEKKVTSLTTAINDLNTKLAVINAGGKITIEYKDTVGKIAYNPIDYGLQHITEK